MHDDGVFNDCQLSDQEFDDEIASIDSQTNVMDHNASNDIIDSQLNSKDDDDDDNGSYISSKYQIWSCSVPKVISFKI